MSDDKPKIPMVTTPQGDDLRKGHREVAMPKTSPAPLRPTKQAPPPPPKKG